MYYLGWFHSYKKFEIGLPFLADNLRNSQSRPILIEYLFGNQEVDLFIFVSVVYYVEFLVFVQLRTLSFEFVILGAKLFGSLIRNFSYCKVYYI